jgi:hypothetical protein
MIGSCRQISMAECSFHRHNNHHSKIRYCNLVFVIQAGYYGGDYRAVEEKNSRCLRVEEVEVPESGCRLPTAWLEGMVSSCRGGMPRVRGGNPCEQRYGSLVQIDNSLDICPGNLKWPLCGCGGRETNSGKSNISDILCV